MKINGKQLPQAVNKKEERIAAGKGILGLTCLVK